MAAIESTTIIDYLFSSTLNQQSNYDSLASSALNRGIDRYSKGDYEGAAREFRRAIGLSPYSQNTPKAVDFMVQSLLKQDKTGEAIKTYKQAIRLSPEYDSYHVNLGNIYFSEGQDKEAIAEYKLAVRINPISSLNQFSLGQALMNTGDLENAEAALKKAGRLQPGDANVSLSLGQTYRRMERFEDAIEQLTSAIKGKKDFGYAYLELGFVYADLKDTTLAREQYVNLLSIDASLAKKLDDRLSYESTPKILEAYTLSVFNPKAGPATSLSALSSSLAPPGASKNITMHFLFSKEMDIGSIVNPALWNIGRANGERVGGAYNWGRPVPSTEVSLQPMPLSVTYNPDTQTADVTFKLSQNAAGNATIDPSHIMFRFSGKDAYGNAMNLSADEYSGISLVV